MPENRSIDRKQYTTDTRKESDIYQETLYERKPIIKNSGKPLHQNYMIIWNYKLVTDQNTISKRTISQ